MCCCEKVIARVCARVFVRVGVSVSARVGVRLCLRVDRCRRARVEECMCISMCCYIRVRGRCLMWLVVAVIGISVQ